MAHSHTVTTDQVGVHEIVLTPNVVETVQFGEDLVSVDVISDGAAPVYFTLAGAEPTVAGKQCYVIPAQAAVDTRQIPTAFNTVVKLISAGTPKISVQRAE